VSGHPPGRFSVFFGTKADASRYASVDTRLKNFKIDTKALAAISYQGFLLLLMAPSVQILPARPIKLLDSLGSAFIPSPSGV
jgi:hypothetical protein